MEQATRLPIYISRMCYSAWPKHSTATGNFFLSLLSTVLSASKTVKIHLPLGFNKAMYLHQLWSNVMYGSASIASYVFR